MNLKTISTVKNHEKQPNPAPLRVCYPMYHRANGFENLFSNKVHIRMHLTNNNFELGGLFFPNFKRKLVGNVVCFRNLLTYVPLNPVVASFASPSAEWPLEDWFLKFMEDW